MITVTLIFLYYILLIRFIGFYYLLILTIIIIDKIDKIYDSQVIYLLYYFNSKFNTLMNHLSAKFAGKIIVDYRNARY